MNEYKGWLLDIFENPQGGIVLWVIGTDGVRQRFIQDFPVIFYAAGPDSQLRALWKTLKQQSISLSLQKKERYDLFRRCLIPVLEIRVDNPYEQPILFRKIEKVFPELDYYDADISLSLRHAARFKTFPFVFCEISSTDDKHIENIRVLETPWEIQQHKIPLRILRIEPDSDPERKKPQAIKVSGGASECSLSFKFVRPLLLNLKAILQQYDPDIVQTRWGDTWLIPELQTLEKNWQIKLPWNREPERELHYKPQKSYFSYGRIVFRGQQNLLFGRIHIDERNAMLWNDYDLSGVIETARITRQPLQQAARQSPGTGISSLQILTALESNILVPYQKQQAEKTKTALTLLLSDRGGIAYQPIIGLHKEVGEIDFVSMYPNIMVKCNISPETHAIGLNERSDEPPGLIPRTLAPLLKKRIDMKLFMETLEEWDPRKKYYQSQVSAHKWLLVTCFGYLGYKNARFGRIESHEAVTAAGREALFRAKETAELLGYDLLHMYVDGLWVYKKGQTLPENYRNLLDEIAENTGLSISLNGIYRWVVFLASRNDPRVPVANRYFGVFQNGMIKTRGIEIRRRDTPLFIGKTQVEILEYLALAENASELRKFVPGAVAIVQKKMRELARLEFDVEELWITQRLSRELQAYRVATPSATAAGQLYSIGKELQPGQKVQFIYIRGKPGVFARELPIQPEVEMVDIKKYQLLLLRAAETVLKPFGWDQEALRSISGGIPALQKKFWYFPT